MSIFYSLFNSFIYAMFISVFLFKCMWLQMRVNVGFIFLVLFAILFLLFLFVIGRKKSSLGKFLFSILSMIIMGVVLYLTIGIERLKVIPAAIIRTGIRNTSLPFDIINRGILIYIAVLVILMLINVDFSKK